MIRVDLAAMTLGRLLIVRGLAREQLAELDGIREAYLQRVALRRRVDAVNDELAARQAALVPDDTSRLAWVIAGGLVDEFIAHFGSPREAEKFLEELDPR